MKDNKQIKELRWEHRGWRKVEDELPPEILEVEYAKGEGVMKMCWFAPQMGQLCLLGTIMGSTVGIPLVLSKSDAVTKSS